MAWYSWVVHKFASLLYNLTSSINHANYINIRFLKSIPLEFPVYPLTNCYTFHWPTVIYAILVTFLILFYSNLVYFLESIFYAPPKGSLYNVYLIHIVPFIKAHKNSFNNRIKSLLKSQINIFMTCYNITRHLILTSISCFMP